MTHYNLETACLECGTGAEISSRLKVRGRLPRKDVLCTLDGDILISAHFKNYLSDVVADLKLNKVNDIEGAEINFYHLLSNLTLPPFEKESIGYVRESVCKACNRNGFFNDVIIGDLENGIKTEISPLKLYYNESIFNNYLGNHLLHTWECTGPSNRRSIGNNVVRYAKPWLLVSEEVKEAF